MPLSSQALEPRRSAGRGAQQDRLEASEASMEKSAKARNKALEAVSDATRRQAVLLARGQAKRSDPQSPQLDANAGSGGKGCLPVTSGYSIAARFGQLGPWSRYHTGLDFSSPVGTPLHAPATGVVTNAGIGPASGWAGNYVAIKYPNGTHTPTAHCPASRSASARPCRRVRSSGPSA